MQTVRISRCVSILATALLALMTGVSGAAEWKAGDRLVTIRDAPVQVGTRTVATVPEGTELVANAVQGDWVAVMLSQDGREITGWIEAKHLSARSSSREAPERRRRKVNTTTVRTAVGTMIVASIPEVIAALDEGEQLKWDYSVTFSCRGDTIATIDRISRRYVDTRGETWTSSGGEWESDDITVPTQGGVQYSSWVRKRELRDGTLVIGFSGRDAKGSAFEGRVTAKLVEGSPKRASSNSGEEMPQATVLSIRESQRQILAASKAWKVEVVCDFPHDAQKEDVTGLRKECEAVLRSGGFQIDDQAPALMLKVRVFGAAKPESYSGAGRRYTGAEVTVNATIETADSRKEAILEFSEAVGSVSPPQSISGGYEAMADAPYSEACQYGRDFHTQLLSVIHAVKGAEAVYRFRSDQDMRVRGHVLAFANASGDRSFVPLLIEELLTGRGNWELGEVAACLGNLGDAKAVEPLSMSLVDEHGNVWEPAASALARLGDAKAIPHLRRALLGATSKPNPVASALRDLQWHPETAKEKVIYWLALDEPNNVKQLQAEATPVLFELVNAEKWAAVTAAQMLGELRERSAVESLSRVLLGGTSSNPWEGRLLRTAAATALAEIAGPKTIEPLAMALMSDGDSGVRKACATGLGKAGGETAFKSLVQAVLADKDAEVVMAAEDALGQSKDRGAVECLSKSLDHNNAGVRIHAAHALKSIGEAQAVAALQKRLNAEKDEEVRKAMAQALAALSNR
jgi:HEAT repeat protein